jgi:RHS repeat-associated protein
MLPSSGTTVSFKYDPFGHRIYKSSSSATSIFAYDGDNLIEEVNATGAIVARYTQTQEIDEPLAMLRSSTTSYYEADGLGSVTSLSSAAGALAQTYTLDSFGKQTASSGSLTNPFQFTGREFDTESSLYFMRARYFNPATGRFVSEDPARFPGGINFYTYVENNPVNLIDPFGFCPWQVHSRPLQGRTGGAAHSIGIDHYYFYNVQTGQSIGLGPAGGFDGGTIKGNLVPGSWERNEKPGHNVGPVPDWGCNCVDKKAKNPGNTPNYCTYQGNKNTNPHPPCTNCAGWVLSVLQDCYNQASAGQQ